MTNLDRLYKWLTVNYDGNIALLSIENWNKTDDTESASLIKIKKKPQITKKKNNNLFNRHCVKTRNAATAGRILYSMAEWNIEQ